MVGYPSPKYFRNMVRLNMILNCPITPAEITASNKISGPNIAALKGKTMCNTPYPALTDYMKIPQKIMDLNRNVTLWPMTEPNNPYCLNKLKSEYYEHEKDRVQRSQEGF
jgi:hypothetical protein